MPRDGGTDAHPDRSGGAAGGCDGAERGARPGHDSVHGMLDQSLHGTRAEASDLYGGHRCRGHTAAQSRRRSRRPRQGLSGQAGLTALSRTSTRRSASIRIRRFLQRPRVRLRKGQPDRAIRTRSGAQARHFLSLHSLIAARLSKQGANRPCNQTTAQPRGLSQIRRGLQQQGDGFQSKGEYDRAIADCDPAIALRPTIAGDRKRQRSPSDGTRQAPSSEGPAGRARVPTRRARSDNALGAMTPAPPRGPAVDDLRACSADRRVARRSSPAAAVIDAGLRRRKIASLMPEAATYEEADLLAPS